MSGEGFALSSDFHNCELISNFARVCTQILREPEKASMTAGLIGSSKLQRYRLNQEEENDVNE